MSQYKVHNSRGFFFSSYVQHTSVLKNKTNNESSAVDSELMVTLMLLHLFTAFSVVLPAYLSDSLSTITVCQTFSYVIHASQHRMKLFGGQLSVCLSIWEQPKVILTLKQYFFFWLSIRMVICWPPFFIHRIRHTQSEHMYVFQRIPEKKIIPIK